MGGMEMAGADFVVIFSGFALVWGAVVAVFNLVKG
jgi:hypothetical protein